MKFGRSCHQNNPLTIQLLSDKCSHFQHFQVDNHKINLISIRYKGTYLCLFCQLSVISWLFVQRRSFSQGFILFLLFIINILFIIIQMSGSNIDALKLWMKDKGCIVHPNVQIPKRFDGVLGIGTNAPLPHKTLIIAVPSNLILSVTKCYNYPTLKRLFEKNDDLFDYQATQDAQFNVLCVFMMYHKLNPQKSEWRQYFQAISQPQTAVDWSNFQLKGLNKSIIEEVVHVRRQCQKLQQELIAYLKKRKEFKNVKENVLRQTFHFCYRAVMNRSFGYYFSQTCLIPVADLVNHSCQTVDHQLVNLNMEKGIQFHEAYFPRKDKIDLNLLGIQKQEKPHLPFRHRFLVENQIVQNNAQTLASLDRKKINNYLYKWNSQKLQRGDKLEDLNFCSQDEEEDNDTDEEYEYEKSKEFEMCKKNQQEQMQQFMKCRVQVQNYKDVEKQLQKMQAKEAGDEEESEKEDYEEEENGQKGKEKEQKLQKDQSFNQQKKQEGKVEEKIEKEEKREQSQQGNPKGQKEQQKQNNQNNKANPFQRQGSKGVPIQLMQSSSQDEQDDEQWGMKQGSYFTMSTSNPIPANTQIFNSYGSRTNKFLLVWYGFTYPDNLYDSVTVRLHVKFDQLMPAKQMVLDTYVGAQGLSFRKNQHQVVKQTQLSKQFRLKRSNMCQRMITFLRLYLMNYYKGQDVYKLLVTFPSSVEYELFVLNYYKEIIQALYLRYPVEVIQELQRQQKQQKYSQISHKIRYKIIYLTQQRKLLDINLNATKQLIAIIQKCRLNNGILKKEMYEHVPIDVLRIIRKYLLAYHQQQQYILYQQQDQVEAHQNENNTKAHKSNKNRARQMQKKKAEIVQKKQEQTKQEDEQWQDIDQQQQKQERKDFQK